MILLQLVEFLPHQAVNWRREVEAVGQKPMTGESVPAFAFRALLWHGENCCHPFNIRRLKLVPALMAPEPSNTSNHSVFF